MRRLAIDLKYIIDNYNSYRLGIHSLNNIKLRFDNIIDKLDGILEDYQMEYNNVQGKPNIPFIPLIAIRDPIYSNNMTTGIYVAILIKQGVGLYISLNQGTENKANFNIDADRERYRRRVADIILDGEIVVIPSLVEQIDLCSTIRGNKKRAKSYERGNIVATFYDKQSLDDNYERFVIDLMWFMELYRKL